MGVLVGVNAGVLVGAGVMVLMGMAVSVGTVGVGEACEETWVNSAATVSAAWVKASPGEAGVDWAPGRLQPTNTTTTIIIRHTYNFLIYHLLPHLIVNRIGNTKSIGMTTHLVRKFPKKHPVR
jgi:hypothetical protein